MVSIIAHGKNFWNPTRESQRQRSQGEFINKAYTSDIEECVKPSR